MSETLLSTTFSTAAMDTATADSAWLQAMLDFETALATTQADANLIPRAAADAINACGQIAAYDVAAIGQQAVKGGNPAIPLVAALTSKLPAHARGHVHYGATSQDVIDTATMRVLKRALPLIVDDLEHIENACARHADQHRATLMPGRTLLQQGPPISFGLKAAGWLVAIRRARHDLQAVMASELAVQFGGAVGTLAPLGEHGVTIMQALATRLDLAAPLLPWHGHRNRLLRIGSALAIAASALGKIALDTALLMQTEVGEVIDPNAGGSSAMPHKRNPVAATLTLAATRRAHGLVAELFTASLHEHERAIGAWHAEWQPLFDCLRVVAAAAQHTRTLTTALQVDASRMQANLEQTRGVTLAEAAKSLLAPHIGRDAAHARVAKACAAALAQGTPLVAILAADNAVTAHVDAATLRQALQPHNYTGSAERFIDRALAGAD